ncbi:piRNA biogenesis protein EXD1 [Ambystoma mexicanum]|uniref:piRNA biogenesis protein EXD1 n=1 Tax=Ambystoma mexicanum TaxID=8296 RepID=UPI0037E956F1
MDPHFLSRILGQKIKVTLELGSFQGVLQHVDPNKAILLCKVKDLESGLNLPGVRLFFGHEIVNVELITEAEAGTSAESIEAPSTNGQVPSAKVTGKIKDSPSAQKEDLVCSPAEPLNANWSSFRHEITGREQEVEYMVIDQFRHKFGPAVRHLKSQNVLGIAAEGVTVCRHGKLCWLQVATKSRVYLFDIFLLGVRAFTSGLQMVLEDKGILKVLHDCRWLSDCLSHQYETTLTNVFDTQVADVFIFSVQTGGFLPHCVSTIEDCLVRHLGISPFQANHLKCSQQSNQDEQDVWFVRPLQPHLLKVLALQAVFLLPLRSVLLDEMMADFKSLVDGHLNTFRDGEPHMLGSAEFSCMKLPEHLRQLTVWKKVRKEKASEEFQMSSEGLLIRLDNSRLQKTSTHSKSQDGFAVSLEDRQIESVHGESPSFNTNATANKYDRLFKKRQPEEECLPEWEEKEEKVDGLLLKGSTEVNFSLQKELENMMLHESHVQPNISDYFSSEASIHFKGPFQALKRPPSPPLSPCPSLEMYTDNCG